MAIILTSSNTFLWMYLNYCNWSGRLIQLGQFCCHKCQQWTSSNVVNGFDNVIRRKEDSLQWVIAKKKYAKWHNMSNRK